MAAENQPREVGARGEAGEEGSKGVALLGERLGLTSGERFTCIVTCLCKSPE